MNKINTSKVCFVLLFWGTTTLFYYKWEKLFFPFITSCKPKLTPLPSQFTAPYSPFCSRLSITYPKMFGNRSVSDIRFWGFWNICTYCEIARGRPSLKTKFMYISYMPHIHSPKVILYNIFSVPLFWLQTITRDQGMEFSTYGIMTCSKGFKFWSILSFENLDHRCCICSSRSHQSSPSAWLEALWWVFLPFWHIQVVSRASNCVPTMAAHPLSPSQPQGFFLNTVLYHPWLAGTCHLLSLNRVSLFLKGKRSCDPLMLKSWVASQKLWSDTACRAVRLLKLDLYPLG